MLGAAAFEASLGSHADVLRILGGRAKSRVGEAWKALGAFTLALIEVVSDCADEAVAVALDPLERPSERSVCAPAP